MISMMEEKNMNHVHCFHVKKLGHIDGFKCCRCGFETINTVPVKQIGD